MKYLSDMTLKNMLVEWKYCLKKLVTAMLKRQKKCQKCYQDQEIFKEGEKEDDYSSIDEEDQMDPPAVLSCIEKDEGFDEITLFDILANPRLCESISDLVRWIEEPTHKFQGYNISLSD